MNDARNIPTGNADNDGKRKEDEFLFLRHLLYAAVSSLITDIVTAPLERVKLILQVQALNKSIPVQLDKDGAPREVTKRRRKGIVYSFRKIIAREGFFALWKGNTATILYTLPNQAFTFALKDKIVALITVSTNVTPKQKPFESMIIGFIGGGVAGSAMNILVYPMDFARTKLATEMFVSKSHRSSTVIGVLTKTYRKAGLLGIYRGLPFSLLGVTIYRSCYFGLYDLGIILIPTEYRKTVSGRVVPAFVASSTASFVSYPLDTVRRTMMVKAPRENNTDLLYAVRKIYRKSGVKGFYYGSIANLLRSTAGAVMLVVYNTIKASAK